MADQDYDTVQNIGKIAGAVRSKKDETKTWADAVTPPSRPTPPTPEADRFNKGAAAKYGIRPCEKRIDVSSMTKPLTAYHTGGVVKETGPALLEKGEGVVPKDKMSMFDLVKGKADETPKKEIKHVNIRKATSGGHIVEHHHKTPEHHPMEEHNVADMAKLHSHLEHFLGSPKPADAEPEADSITAANGNTPAVPPAGAVGQAPPVGVA